MSAHMLKDKVCVVVISVWDFFCLVGFLLFCFVKLNEQICTTVNKKSLNSYGNNQVQ